MPSIQFGATLLPAAANESNVAWGIDPKLVNAKGGAISLGHPLSASGGRILGTLTKRLIETGERWGVAAICIGVGQGLAVVLENHLKAADRDQRTSCRARGVSDRRSRCLRGADPDWSCRDRTSSARACPHSSPELEFVMHAG